MRLAPRPFHLPLQNRVPLCLLGFPRQFRFPGHLRLAFFLSELVLRELLLGELLLGELFLCELLLCPFLG
ncbi:MAG: hypothetical protein WCA59_19070 [Candidatus Binataceae bacterium]